MLREVNINELIQTDDPVIVISGYTVYTAEEFFCDDIRILIDEGAAADPEEEEEPEEEEVEEEPEEPEEEEEPKPAKKRVYRKRGPKSYKDRVGEACEAGATTIAELVEATGLSEDVCRKYMLEIEKEDYDG